MLNGKKEKGEKKWREREGGVRERERDEESMRIGKERKTAKRERNSSIFEVVRKYLNGEEKREKQGSYKGPESIFHINKPKII